MSANKWTDYYHVAKDGSVYSISTNWRGLGARRMRAIPNSKGYLRVRLTVNGHRKSYFVHKLVAEVFLPPRPSGVHEIRHLDGNPTNNEATNLAWGTRSENAIDRIKHGRQHYPQWTDPAFRAKAIAGMKAAHALRAKARSQS